MSFFKRSVWIRCYQMRVKSNL